MKQVHLSSKWPIILLSGMALVTSCKKDNSIAPPDSETLIEAATSEAQVSGQFSDVFNITMGVQSADVGEEIGLGTDGGIIYKPMGINGTASPEGTRCFTVTVVPKVRHEFPKTVTIDFGAGCLGRDGKIRKGKIVTIFTGPMFIPDSKTSTTFVDYAIDSFEVKGTFTVENTSSSNKQEWTVNVINGKITNTQSNKWKSWDATRVRKQVGGNGTPLYFQDDIFQITGNGTGARSNGNSWKSLITTPLIKKFNCDWRSKGKAAISINTNTNTAILDYGNGDCDNKATITINGVVHNITLN